MEGTYVQLRWWPFGDLVEDRGVSDARVQRVEARLIQDGVVKASQNVAL